MDIFKWISYYWRILRLNYKRKGIIPILKFLLIILIGSLVSIAILQFGETSSLFLNKIAKYLGLPVSIILIVYNLSYYLKKEYGTSAKDIFTKYTIKYSLKEHLGIQAEIQKEMLTLFKVWIRKKEIGKKRILLFIDDIDRCDESKIIQIVDSLRIMLDENEIAKRCVILAAVDERILKIAISSKYYDLVTKDFNIEADKRINLSNLVREYMDKLFIGGVKLKTLNEFERTEILRSLTTGKVNVNQENKTIETGFNKRTEYEKLIEPLKKGRNNLKDNHTAIAYKKEEVFELEYFEYTYLKEVLKAAGLITPRVIRIFYYRYLLAKRFLYAKTFKNEELFKEWNNAKTDKSILPYLIMFFTVSSRPEQINNSFITWSVSHVNMEKHLDGCQFTLLNKQFMISEELLKEILQIIEIIVPY